MINTPLHYKSFGNSDNPETIILLHGMLGSMDNWRSQAQRLSTHYHVITPDLRNHGKSPHLSGMRYQEMAQDVLDLSNHLGIESFDLLGHSMGGKIAMEMALRPITMVQRLIIVDIAPKSYPLWHLDIFNALLSLPVSSLTSRGQADELLSQAIKDPFERAFLLKNLKSKQSGGYIWRCNLKEITRAYLNIANFPQKSQARYCGETLFIKGEDSPYLDLEKDPSNIEALFPRASLQIIESSGHTPHIEKPDAFYQHIHHFLGLPTIG